MSTASQFPDEGQPATPADERMSQTTFLAVAWATTGLSLLFVLFRLAVRVRSFKALYVDDGLVIAAWLMLLVSSIIWQIKASLLYWQFDVTNGRAPPTPAFIAAWATFMPHIVTWNVLFYSCLWAVKLSFLVFFRRLLGSKTTREGKIGWWVICALVVAGWVACVADIDYKCTINDNTYILTQCPRSHHIYYQNRTFYANMAADIATDLLVMSIPLWILWNVQIPRQKKLLLAGIFSVTVFIMVVAVIRVVLVKGSTDQLQNASIDWLYMWSNVEMGVAIIVACLASFRQLFIFKKHASPGAKSPQSSWTERIAGSRLHFLRLTSKKSTESQDDLAVTAGSERAYSSDPASRNYTVPLDSVHVSHTIEVSSHKRAPGTQEKRGYREFV
ncbi:hypothetical protein TOPH_00772 [Tolypocladium ophioglossoides CBS 100239]|uniref:Rhodopsin domain-containing protein n=1 Tax=Tolypocladium ophioglossoides (strain CBS 100239) TaxID=1163406 RepID=A0A0L0NKF6_TOLOC|nr:hypothetical protein TOPH_00772 [Tolypocladium ophioglossoides CBS 100239]